MKGSRRKYNVHGYIKMLLGGDCEVKKVISKFKQTNLINHKRSKLEKQSLLNVASYLAQVIISLYTYDK